MAKEYIINWANIQEEIVYSVKNKTTLYFKDSEYESLTCKINNKKQLEITNNDKTITLSNYSSIKYIKTDTDGIINIINKSKVDNTSNAITTYKKGKTTGTIYNDKIDVHEYTLYNKDGSEKLDTKKMLKGLTINAGNGDDEIKATKYKDTIIAGAGNDVIYSSLGNDSIKGGSGANTIIYSGSFDKDTIILTNKENLKLDFSSYDFDGDDVISYKISGANLVLTVKNSELTYGTIVLKNFAKKNIVKTGYVRLYTTDTNYIDLNTFDALTYTYENFSKKGVFKGSRFSETIDARGVERGATISAGSGYNTIYSTMLYKDKITGGNDGNYIYAYSGTKTITTGKGADTIYVDGEGTRTIKAGSGTNNIIVLGDGKTSVTTGSGDDYIYISGDGVHTIKAGSGDNNITVYGSGKNTITSGTGNDIITVVSNTSTTINAGNGTNDVTLNSTATGTIKTGKDNDIINLKGNSKKTVYAGGGVNTIYIDNSSNFGNIIIKEQSVKATNKIVFSENNFDYFVYSKSGKSLIIEDIITGAKITLEQYYGTNKKYADYEFYLNDTLYTLEDLQECSKGTKMSGSGIIKGSDEDDVIISTSTGTKVVNDTITAGKGNDIIKAGMYVNYLFFYEGDGNDTIINGGGTDTLKFEAGTELLFNQNNDDLIIYYGTKGDSITIKDYAKSTSVKYIDIGGVKKQLSHYYTIIERGKSAGIIKISSDETTLILTNTFDGHNYRYTISSLLDKTEDAQIKYLANGRLVIEGENLKITAADGQTDDIILLGSNNELYTNDGDDIVRLGYVIDSNYQKNESPYTKRSDFNTINMGEGDDYLIYYGVKNEIDMQDGNDSVCVRSSENIVTENIINSEETRHVNTISSTTDGQIGWYNQWNSGGDCRLLALFSGLSECKDFSLNDYVNIEQNSYYKYVNQEEHLEQIFQVYFDDDTPYYNNNNDTKVYITKDDVILGWNVTFKNYLSENNSTVVLQETLYGNNQYVLGDLDVVLMDTAMNQLISQNKDEGQNSVFSADYNTLSDYMFGTKDTTYISYYNSAFETKLAQLWQAYIDGEISNVSIGTPYATTNSELGIIGQHAYSLKNLTNTYVELVNPWDSRDVLRLDLNTFYAQRPYLIVYGYDVFNQNTEFPQGTAYPNTNIDEIYNVAACWTNTSSSDLCNINIADTFSSEVSSQIYESLFNKNIDNIFYQ